MGSLKYLRAAQVRCSAIAGLALFGVLTLSGCNEEDPAEAMLQAQPRASSAPPSQPAGGPPPGGAPATPNGTAPATPNGTAPDLGAPATGGAPGAAPAGLAAEDPAKEDVKAGPEVDIQLQEVKSPYPEFTGKGNYSIKLSVEGKEPTDFAVWEFIAYDAKDKEVGRIPQALKIPFKNVKNLEFSNIYFMGKPARFELILTDKKPVRAEPAMGEGSDSGGGGISTGGNDLGNGGGSTPPAGGGGGSAPPSGGGGDGGGGDDDKGGEE